jgi:tRNA dimethylallyltransferase
LRRTVRAIEVILSSGELFSKQRKRSPTPYLPFVIGLNRPRTELYDRIDARIAEMVHKGLLEEVRQILSRGYSPDLPTMSAIGYREMVGVINGQISMEEAITQMKRRTRIFVRRQANWFSSKDPKIHWFEMDANTANIVENEIRIWFQNIGTKNVME